jgi:NAD(P)H-dependent FMN reductase
MADPPTLLVVCGSRREPSRTRTLATRAATIASDSADVETLDLRAAPMQLFDGRDHGEYDDVTTGAVSRVLDADAYVVASPVYFGGMPGALKNLFDHLPYERVTERDRAAGLVMTGRDRRHHHVLDRQLRSTLVYFDVDVATSSVFASEDDFEDFALATEGVDPYLETTVAETLSLAAAPPG